MLAGVRVFRRLRSRALCAGAGAAEPEALAPVSGHGLLHYARKTAALPVDDLGALVAGRYYELPGVEDAFQEGIAADVREEFEALRASQLMLRAPAAEMLRALGDAEEAPAEERAMPLALAWGPTMSGKTTALHQLVYAARQRGWLTVFIPSAADWTLRAGGALAVKGADPELFDVHDMSVDLLRNLRQNHEALLREMPLRASYDHKYYEVRAEGAAPTVLDLVLTGIRMPDMAPEALRDFRGELELMDPATAPVLIAVDDYNAFFEPVAYTRRGGDEIKAHRLAVVDCFGELHQSHDRAPVRGLMVGATSERRRQHKNPQSLKRKTKPHQQFFFGPYDEEETLTALSQYHARRFLGCDLDRSELIMMQDSTRGLPGKIRKHIAGLSYLM